MIFFHPRESLYSFQQQESREDFQPPVKKLMVKYFSKLTGQAKNIKISLIGK